MKKIYSLMLVAFASVHFVFGQCVIDSANTSFFSPTPDSLPCIERTVAYNQVIQINVPDSINLQDYSSQIPFAYWLHVDSVVIDSALGLPTGISYQENPASGVLYGGQRGCATVYGTTTDTAGHYPVTFVGTLTAHGAAFPPFFSGDTTMSFAELQSLSSKFAMYVDVIEPGNPCRPAISGIKNMNADLNSLVNVYPNPNNGVFNFNINAGGRINGEINVLDATGRKIYSQSLDIVGAYSTTIDLSKFAKGLYTVQLKTAEGIAAKNISTE